MSVGCWLYGTPISPAAGVNVSAGAAAMAMVTDFVALWPLASVTWTTAV